MPLIEVLYFSDKHVKQRLFARVTGAGKLTLVAVIPPHRASLNPARKEPFATLERRYGAVLDQVLVVDEGTAEGMWRDPVVDLADALYASDTKAAYAAARGYFFVKGGRPRATVKKYGEPAEDQWFLEEALSKLDATVAAPDPARRPGRGKATGAGSRKPKRPAAGPANTIEDAMPTASDVDAFTVLGIARGVTLTEAKRAWKALLVQYHPDKVAHLAPEFRALAETKTRAIMEAWAAVQAELEEGR